MTDYCHKHSRPIPLRKPSALTEYVPRCQLCWLACDETEDARFWCSARLDILGDERDTAIIEAGDRATYSRITAKASWVRRPDEANATEPTQATSIALPHIYLGILGPEVLEQSPWPTMRARILAENRPVDDEHAYWVHGTCHQGIHASQLRARGGA